MKPLVSLLLFLLLHDKVAECLINRSRQQPQPRQHRPETRRSSSTTPPHDFSNEAAALFGNVRIPAALFAGAAAGSAFALPLMETAEGSLRIGLVKRLYAVLMMGALSSEVVAVVVSTLAVTALGTQSKALKQQQQQENVATTSLHDFLAQHYDLEWLTTRLHFFSGVILFSVAIGLRAWISIACPIISRAALGIVLSSTMLCLSFWRQLDETVSMEHVMSLPWRYTHALWTRARTSGMFATSLIMSVATAIYILANIPHVYHYLLLRT
mmetsp:Transcript_12105/g.22507  ORF Transcript_12105/g.22507 Transcript_12105/m.22507 type:complete len:269 (-) Transcript_12105:261-1067(-)